MNKLHSVLLVSALALPAAAWAADKSVDHTGCDNVNWSREVLDAFPRAQEGCQKIMIKDDVVYAQYIAEVVGADKEGITVNLKDRAGKNMTQVKFEPNADAMIRVNDKDIKFRDVQKGTELRFYMPRDRWGLFSSPGGTAMKILSAKPL